MEKLNEVLLGDIADLVRELNLMKDNADLIRRIISEEETAGKDKVLLAGARASLAKIGEMTEALEQAIAAIHREPNTALGAFN